MFVAFSGLRSASTAPQQHLRTDWFSCLAPASTPKISWLLCAQKLSSFSFMDVPPITHVRHGTCSLQHSYNDIISYRSLHHHHWTTLPPWRRGRLLPLSSWLWKPGTSWQLIMVSVWFAGMEKFSRLVVAPFRHGPFTLQYSYNGWIPCHSLHHHLWTNPLW